MTFKEKYMLAKMNGEKAVELFRGDEISRRISKVYPLSAQIAVLMDKETKPEKAQKYQAFRETVIAEVDREIEEIEGG